MSDSDKSPNLIQQYDDEGEVVHGGNRSGDEHSGSGNDHNKSGDDQGKIRGSRNNSTEGNVKTGDTTDNGTPPDASVNLAKEAVGKKPAKSTSRGRTTRGRVAKGQGTRKSQEDQTTTVHWKKADVDAMIASYQQGNKKREDDLKREINNWKKELDRAHQATQDAEERVRTEAQRREIQIFEDNQAREKALKQDAQNREDALRKDARDKETKLQNELKDKEAKFMLMIQQRDDVARKEAQDREEEWKKKIYSITRHNCKVISHKEQIRRA